MKPRVSINKINNLYVIVIDNLYLDPAGNKVKGILEAAKYSTDEKPIEIALKRKERKKWNIQK